MVSNSKRWSVLCLWLLGTSFSEPSHAKSYQSFADIAESAIPGVVNIRTKSYVKRETGVDLYDFFLQGRLPQSGSNSALGSGVILDKKGHIVTNHHVIKDATTIEVLFAKSKQKVSAKVVGVDLKTDIALLKVESRAELVPLSFGNSDLLRIGDIVLAIGNPFGFSHTVTSGIISAKGRVIGTGPYDNFLQTDAAIHPGNSGGPLLDVRGRAIGINTAVSSEGSGIGFAIPMNLVMEVVKDLKTHGKVIRPWLGVIGKNILSQEDVDKSVDPTGVFGVIVTNLIIDGPAYKAGLRIGDLIMNIGQEKVYDLHMMQRLLSKHRPMEQVALKIYRRGKGFINTTVGLEEIPKNEDLPQEKDLF
jgi:S1-C subfamily serine protease